MDKTIKITIKEKKCLDTRKTFKTAVLPPNIGDGYGLKRFITIEGEVAIIDFFNDGIPPVFEEINNIFKEVEDRKKSIDINDAWRYFADLSKNGCQWYMEAIYYKLDCFGINQPNETEILETKEVLVIPVKITFDKWMSLNNMEKKEFINLFIKNPVKCNYPISNHLLHGKLLK